METNFEKVLNDMVNEDKFVLTFYSNLIINGELTCCKIRLITISHQICTNDFEG